MSAEHTLAIAISKKAAGWEAVASLNGEESASVFCSNANLPDADQPAFFVLLEWEGTDNGLRLGYKREDGGSVLANGTLATQGGRYDVALTGPVAERNILHFFSRPTDMDEVSLVSRGLEYVCRTVANDVNSTAHLWLRTSETEQPTNATPSNSEYLEGYALSGLFPGPHMGLNYYASSNRYGLNPKHVRPAVEWRLGNNIDGYGFAAAEDGFSIANTTGPNVIMPKFGAKRVNSAETWISMALHQSGQYRFVSTVALGAPISYLYFVCPDKLSMTQLALCNYNPNSPWYGSESQPGFPPYLIYNPSDPPSNAQTPAGPAVCTIRLQPTQYIAGR